MSDDNVIDGPWQGDPDGPEVSQEDYDTAMEELLSTIDTDRLGMIIGGALEVLTMQAIDNGSFYLQTDDERAITVIAVDDAAKQVKDNLPNSVALWEDRMKDFDSNRDPGDEQDEPTT
jgi:hypothetical protein